MATVIGNSGPRGMKNITYRGEVSINDDPLIPAVKSFFITYYVIASSINDTPLDIEHASGLPKIGEKEEDCFCVKKEPRETQASALLWEVDAFFMNHVDVSGRITLGPYNAKRDFDYRWSSEMIEKIVTRDPVNGRPVANAVGEPLLLTAPVAIPTVTITRIEPFIDTLEFQQFSNHTNKDTWWDAEPGLVLCSEIGDEPVEIKGVCLRRVSYVMKFDLTETWIGGISGQDVKAKLGWKVQLANRGTFYYETAEDAAAQKNPIAFRDKYKDKINGNLELTGTFRPYGDPTYLLFHRYPEANFAGLQIPKPVNPLNT